MWHVAQRVTTFTKSSPLVTFFQFSGVFPMDGTFPATIQPLFPSTRSLATIPLSHYTRLMWLQNLTKCVLHKSFILSRSARFLTPINAVIKNSDRNRARTIAHINITDQDSLARASTVLVAQGLSKIKIRLTTDHSATGLNYCSYSPPFSYPTISDALKIVTPNCFMCSATSSGIFTLILLRGTTATTSAYNIRGLPGAI